MNCRAAINQPSGIGYGFNDNQQFVFIGDPAVDGPDGIINILDD